jgi:hypothetical protein
MPKGKKYVNATGKKWTPKQKAKIKRMVARKEKRKAGK